MSYKITGLGLNVRDNRKVVFPFPPAHEMGFTADQVEDILDNDPVRIKAFEKWMVGQTMTGDPEMGAIIYPWDLERFILDRPIID